MAASTFDLVSVAKADPNGDEELLDLNIVVEGKISGVDELNLHDSLAALDAKFELDAAELEIALHDHLPGGTYSALLSAMLERRKSHFRVSFASFGAGKKA